MVDGAFSREIRDQAPGRERALAQKCRSYSAGRLEATIAGYAFSPLTKGWLPELCTAIAQFRDALGDQAYETLARDSKTMTTAEMATTHTTKSTRPAVLR